MENGAKDHYHVFVNAYAPGSDTENYVFVIDSVDNKVGGWAIMGWRTVAGRLHAQLKVLSARASCLCWCCSLCCYLSQLRLRPDSPNTTAPSSFVCLHGGVCTRRLGISLAMHPCGCMPCKAIVLLYMRPLLLPA